MKRRITGIGLVAIAAVLARRPAPVRRPRSPCRCRTRRPAPCRIIRRSARASTPRSAAGETVREIKSAYFPTVFASFTGAQAQNGASVIAAGGLNNSTVLDRFAYGFSASQLLTDFGRTTDLTASATLRVDAYQQDVEARRADVLLDVDRAYFDALRAQAVLQVAEQTVTARQLVVDQVTALASTGLKSVLDLSFAKVNLSEAQLLLVQAKNDVQASYAGLSAAMGTPQTATYVLSDEGLPEPPSGRQRARSSRRRCATGRTSCGSGSSQQSQAKFAEAERALWSPDDLAHRRCGSDAVPPDRLERPVLGRRGERDGAADEWQPVFRTTRRGQLPRERRAAGRAGPGSPRDPRRAGGLARRTDRPTSDSTSPINCWRNATDALDLAQQRYNLGLSSIVELTQAQLNQTRAQIEQATARYEYQARSAALRFQMGALK